MWHFPGHPLISVSASTKEQRRNKVCRGILIIHTRSRSFSIPGSFEWILFSNHCYFIATTLHQMVRRIICSTLLNVLLLSFSNKSLSNGWYRDICKQKLMPSNTPIILSLPLEIYLMDLFCKHDVCYFVWSYVADLNIRDKFVRRIFSSSEITDT